MEVGLILKCFFSVLGVVREQSKHQTGEDLLVYPAAGSAGGKGHNPGKSGNLGGLESW